MRTIEEIKADIETAIASHDAERMNELYHEKALFYMRNIPLNRLEEICNAEREDRCMALPCKVGDKVYAYCDVFHRVLAYFVEQVIIDYSDINEVLITFNANCTENYELMDSIDFVREDIGKTVFLTREEAEKALKERETIA